MWTLEATFFNLILLKVRQNTHLHQILFKFKTGHVGSKIKWRIDPFPHIALSDASAADDFLKT